MTLLGRRGECKALDAVLADALAGRSRVVVLRGEAGAGKSALLGYVSERVAAWHVATAVGVESEMELAYSGLHQLCASMLGDLDRLPPPQRAALATVFGRDAGPAPDPFLVGLATLTLLAEVAEHQPLVCVVDDAQWLDATSARILGFVARRLLAERIAFVCAARTGIGDGVFDGLPVLSVGGLGESDARALLLANVRGPFDARVAEQIITESHGNPLALIELPRTWRGADLAGGFGPPPVAGSTTRSSTATPSACSCFPARPARSFSPRPRSRWAIPCCCSVPPSCSALTWLPPARRRTPGCSRSAAGSSSRTRSPAPRPTTRPRPTTATACTVRSRTRPMPSGIPTGARGIAPAPRAGRTRMSPPSSSARPTVHRRAAASRQRPPSSSARPRCRRIR